MPDPVPRPPGRPPGEPIIIKDPRRPPEVPEIDGSLEDEDEPRDPAAAGADPGKGATAGALGAAQLPSGAGRAAIARDDR